MLKDTQGACTEKFLDLKKNPMYVCWTKSYLFHYTIYKSTNYANKKMSMQMRRCHF